MLQSLHVKNIALIDDVEIDFTRGLNILTGETGAGKSILIDSVNFALGQKVPKHVVREDAQYALSELVFSIDDEEIIKQLIDMDICMEDNELILQRRISNGKSTCRINGETVPTARVKEVASLLIDIHGQHEHQSLLYKKNHKQMLDSFCGNQLDLELCKLEEAYDKYKGLEKEYEKAMESSSTKQADLDYAAFVVDEIEMAGLNIGEDEKLEADYSRMNNARKIAEALSTVRAAMSEDSEGAGNGISCAYSAMKQIAQLDESAGHMLEMLASLEDIVQDFNRSLFDYEESLEFSQEEYHKCEERLNEINRLKDKYGNTIEAIIKRGEEESLKIARLQDIEGYLNNLSLEKDKCYDILLSVCSKVSSIRKEEAKKLEKEIVLALNNLNFLDAKFEIKIDSDDSNISRSGYDDVEFMISTNPGESVRPLTLVASGGELSRIMLALKSILAKRDVIGTLIFDEIDTGISGKTAQRVADRMSDIAERHQVICITHLPQIASHANGHFLIEKKVEEGHTRTIVSRLSEEETIDEIARMLAGETITDTVRQNAAEMIRTARK